VVPAEDGGNQRRAFLSQKFMRFHQEAVMKGNHGGKDGVRVELKYCEHCGGLWVREGGAGVYCEKCQDQVADLPIPKKKSGRIVLPVAKKSVVGDRAPEPLNENDREFEAAGGVA
jgi:hypothetical protein